MENNACLLYLIGDRKEPGGHAATASTCDDSEGDHLMYLPSSLSSAQRAWSNICAPRQRGVPKSGCKPAYRSRTYNIGIAEPSGGRSQDGIKRSAAEVFNRPQPATGETFTPLFTMLLQLFLYYGVLQPIRNLLRFLKIDSEVFRSRTPGEPFDGAQSNRGLFTIFSDALHYDVPAQFPPGWSQAPANHKGGISVKTPRFFPVPI